MLYIYIYMSYHPCHIVILQCLCHGSIYHILSQIYHSLSVINVITIIHYTIYITMLLYIYINKQDITITIIIIQVMHHYTSHLSFTYHLYRYIVPFYLYVTIIHCYNIYIYIQVTICHISHI